MSTWQLTLKPSFLNELNTLDRSLVNRVTRKLELLQTDPRPDAKVKKQLKNMGGKLHRLRAGDLRIFYTFEEPFVSLLSVKRRNESTYDDDVDIEFLGGPADGADAVNTNVAAPPAAERAAWEAWLAPPARRGNPLPRAVDAKLLAALDVPGPFHEALLAAATEEDLLECEVPQDLLLKVLDAVLGKSEEERAREPDLMLDDTSDLLRFRQGDLLAFLLRLNPEQERMVAWGVKSDHPTLLKGGPGTGKSTVALYRARSMIQTLRKRGVELPRILFTTYTRALTRVSEQLLERLLGKDAALVSVRTADAVIREIAAVGDQLEIARDEDVKLALSDAASKPKLEGNPLAVAAQQEAIAKLGATFLLDEIRSVIEARGLRSLDAYREAPRPGRRRALTKLQREAVWRVYEGYREGLALRKKTTFEGLRIAARARVESGAVAPSYDGVIVDEVQDLAPTTLGVLVGLAKTRGGIFLTADANQSIYGSSFRWRDVHEGLSFQGSTALLRANHRSTREIGEAAFSYLEAGAEGSELDETKVIAEYVHEGALPAVRAVESESDEARLLLRFFRGATRDLRLGLGACAVLTPTNAAAARIAADLRELGLLALKVGAGDLDLGAPGVKVLTQRSAKGLEFPVVAVAGFDANGPPEDGEGFGESRRAVFVAMTRAMRALLVVIPSPCSSSLLEGFDEARWNVA